MDEPPGSVPARTCLLLCILVSGHCLIQSIATSDRSTVEKVPLTGNEEISCIGWQFGSFPGGPTSQFLEIFAIEYHP